MMSRLNREILNLATPNIISNISVPLLSTVDTALMGHLSPVHLGAVGLSSMIFNFIYWNFGFLRMGTTGMTAQAYGKGGVGEMSWVFSRSVGLSLLIAIVLILAQVPILKAAISLLNVPPDQVELVSAYFSVRIWAAPASLALFSVIGWMFGMQNALYPLFITLLINVCNIALSFYMVLGLDMGIRGVAIATLVAQYAGLLFAGLLIIWRYRQIVVDTSSRAAGRLADFFKVNIDLFIRTLCLTIAFAFFYSQSASAGELVLAANVILMQFINWMSYGIDGFAFASESLVGKYAGARQPTMVRKVVTRSFTWGLGVAIFYAILFGIGGQSLFRIYTDDPEVLSLTRKTLGWLIVLPLIAVWCYIWDGVFIGLTASGWMRNTMVAALAIYIAVFLLMAPFTTFAVWYALMLFLGIRGLLLAVVWWSRSDAMIASGVFK